MYLPASQTSETDPIHPAPSYNGGHLTERHFHVWPEVFLPQQGEEGITAYDGGAAPLKSKSGLKDARVITFTLKGTAVLVGGDKQQIPSLFIQTERQKLLYFYLFVSFYTCLMQLYSSLGVGPAALLHRVHEGQIHSPYNLNILEIPWQQTSICSI